MQLLFDIQRATLAARSRTGDATISTRAEAGKLQVGRVTCKPGKNLGDFAPLTKWLPIPDAIRALENI